MSAYQFRFYQVSIPLKVNYNHHLKHASLTDSVIGEVCIFEGHKIYGECCPRSYVTGETSESTVDEANKSFKKYFDLFLAEPSLERIEIILSTLHENHLSLKCLFETIFLNYLSVKNSVTFFDLFNLNDTGQNYTCSYTADIPSASVEVGKKFLEFYSSLNFSNIKIKITDDTNNFFKTVDLISSYFPSFDMSRLIVDANGCFSYEKFKSISLELIKRGIRIIEQPFKVEDLNSAKKLKNEFNDYFILLLDESITTMKSLNLLLEYGYFDGAVLKISKNGGLLQTQKMANLMLSREKIVNLGCHVVEFSSLTLMGIILKGLVPQLSSMEGAYGTWALTHDFFVPSIKFHNKGIIVIDEQFKKLNLIQNGEINV